MLFDAELGEACNVCGVGWGEDRSSSVDQTTRHSRSCKPPPTLPPHPTHPPDRSQWDARSSSELMAAETSFIRFAESQVSNLC
jgi:hypothetical protein